MLDDPVSGGQTNPLPPFLVRNIRLPSAVRGGARGYGHGAASAIPNSVVWFKDSGQANRQSSP